MGRQILRENQYHSNLKYPNIDHWDFLCSVATLFFLAFGNHQNLHTVYDTRVVVKKHQNNTTGNGAGSGNSPRPYLIQMRVSVKMLANIVQACGPKRFVFLWTK